MKRKQRLIVLFAGVWLVGVLMGLRVLWAYSSTPGSSGLISEVWTAQSRLQHADDRATFVLFVHPQCPCSDATLDELAKIIARCREQVAVRVVAVKPKDAPAAWEQTALLNRARAMPGVTVSIDDGGEQAKFFGARTSGHANLYDAGGRLLFSGGITSARGHDGDNAGSDAIVELVQHRAAATARTNVYGCSLAIDAPASPTGASTCPR